MNWTSLLGCALVASLTCVGCEITTYECPDHPWNDDGWPFDDDGDEDDCVGDCEPLPAPDPEPDPSPCPDGECGCADDDECDTGLWCIDALCTDPAEVCVFDFECGEDATCLDNECHELCECECPIGQSCIDGVCLDSVGSDGCIFDDDCGDAAMFVCIDATCHPACTVDEDCTGSGEACVSGACRADARPTRECASDDDCAEDVICERGLCRLQCVADINCGEPTPLCGDSGFCINESESNVECLRSSDCEAEGSSCRDGHCQTEG